MLALGLSALLAACSASIAGTWTGTLTNGGSLGLTFTLSGSGNSYTGTFELTGVGNGTVSATLDGSNVVITATLTSGGSGTSVFTGTLSANTISGTWNYNGGSDAGSFSVTKQ